MNIEYFIAHRMKLSGDGQGSSIATRIAKISVTIGMVVMIVALAVIGGFRKDITELLSGFGSHIQVVHLDGNSSFETVPISKDQPFLSQIEDNDKISSVSPYAIKAGITRSQNDIQGIVLKGVDHTYDWSFFSDKIVEGTLPRISDTLRTKDVIISQHLANMLRLELGQDLDMLFIEQPARRDKFRICGIYNTGMNKVDDLLAITDIRNVQRLNRWQQDQITGFEILCKNLEELDQTTIEVDDIVYEAMIQQIGNQPDALGDAVVDTATTTRPIVQSRNLMVKNIKETNPIIFDWLKTHDLNALVIIVIMLAVSILGMISAILIIILERVKMIGTLKTLGMCNRSIQKIFIIRSSRIILSGLVLGNTIGVAACLAQLFTGVVKLDAGGYFLSVVPIDLNIGWLLVLNISVFAIITLAVILPTLIISLISPEKSVRYE